MAGGTIIIDPCIQQQQIPMQLQLNLIHRLLVKFRNTSPSLFLQLGDGVSTDAGGNTSGFYELGQLYRIFSYRISC